MPSVVPLNALTGLHGTITPVAKAIIFIIIGSVGTVGITFLSFRHIGHIAAR